MLKELSRGVVILAVGLFIGALQAAPTLVVDGGVLTGARNVVVNGTLYDVDFVDGTCAALFSGCDAASDFSFPSEAAAVAASQALLDNVFINGPAGRFDAIPEATMGCTYVGSCAVHTPGDPETDAGSPFVRMAVATNHDECCGPDGVYYWVGLHRQFDTSQYPSMTFAVWSSVVPEPHAGSYLAIGGFVLALAMLRQRRSADRTSKQLS